MKKVLSFTENLYTSQGRYASGRARSPTAFLPSPCYHLVTSDQSV